MFAEKTAIRFCIITIPAIGALITSAIAESVIPPWITFYLTPKPSSCYLPRWMVVYFFPGTILLGYSIYFIFKNNYIKKILFSAIIVIFICELVSLIPFCLYINASLYKNKLYTSRREYYSIKNLPSDIHSPGLPLVFEIGEHLRLAFSAVCFADPEKRTLPITGQYCPETSFPKTSPRPLSNQGVRNLTVLAKVIGYLRYFNPSDEAIATNWECIAASAVHEMEGAETNLELLECLRSFFLPLSCSVQFLGPGDTPHSLEPPATTAFAVRWRHQGLELPIAPAKPDPGRDISASKEDRTTRLAGVILTWCIFQHFYPYLDAVAADWATRFPEALRSAAMDTTRRDFIRTLRRFTAGLRDGHLVVSNDFLPDDILPAIEISLLEGQATVTQTYGTAKVLPRGSEILAIDGESLIKRIQRLRAEIGAATEAWLQKQLSWALLAGPPGSPLSLKYRTPDGQIRTVILTRDGVDADSLESSNGSGTAILRPGVFYVDLGKIKKCRWPRTLEQIQISDYIIIDFRNYRSDIDDYILFDLIQHLTRRGVWGPRLAIPVITRPDRQGWNWDLSGNWLLAPKGPRINGKCIFLIDGSAISSAETFLSIIENYQLGLLVGEPTAGTNGNINQFELPGGYRIRWTGMKVTKQDGSPHHGVGIHPTVWVKPTAHGIALGHDELLDKALSLCLIDDH